MSSTMNLTLHRWAPELVGALRGPRGRVARVLTYFLAHARGPSNARTALDFIRAVEPELIWELRDHLLTLPEQERHDVLERRVADLRRRVNSAFDACQTRWGLPLVAGPVEGYYVDLPNEPSEFADLYSVRDQLPLDMKLSFSAALERLNHLARALSDGAADPRSGQGQSASKARRKWGVRPKVYAQPDSAWELRREYDRLLHQLTVLARAVHGESGGLAASADARHT